MPEFNNILLKLFFSVRKKISKNLKHRTKKTIKTLLLISYATKYSKFLSILKYYKKHGLFTNSQLQSILTIPSYTQNIRFDLSKRIDINTHHYNFFKTVIPKESIKDFFSHGINILTTPINNGDISIILKPSNYLMYSEEGPLSIVMQKNSISIYIISFVFFPSTIYTGKEGNSILITRSQGLIGYEIIKEVTKAMDDIEPARILFKVLESVATICNINYVYGVHYKNQVLYSQQASLDNVFYNNYDNFWVSNNGVQLSDMNYKISVPTKSKDIEMIKQNHRNRTLKKRNRLNEIYISSLKVLSSYFNNTGA